MHIRVIPNLIFVGAALHAAIAGAQCPPQDSVEANPPSGCDLAATFADGPAARDWSYRGLKPIISGGTNWSSSGYFSFGGADNPYIDYGGTNFNSSTHVTYACWFRRTNAWTQSTIIGGGYYSGPGGRPFLARWDGERVQFGWYSPAYGYKVAILSYELDLDRWYHAAGTYDGQNIRLYIDGALKATTSTSETIPVAEPVNARLLIGAQWWYSYGHYFAGDICDVLIFDRAITAAEIQDLYQRGKSEGK